jgi:DNA-directed RNA polymerase specialized sigma24 family protein
MDSAFSRFKSRVADDDRDDLRQELWSACLGWDGQGELAKILHNTARNFVDGRRRETRHYSVETLAESRWLSVQSPLTAEKMDLSEALSLLSPLEREIVELYMNGLNKRGIAKQMGRSRMWVWYIMRDAFQKIKEQIGEDYLCRLK